MFYESAINKAEGQTMNKKITETHLSQIFFPKRVSSFIDQLKKKKVNTDRKNRQTHEQLSHKSSANDL